MTLLVALLVTGATGTAGAHRASGVTLRAAVAHRAATGDGRKLRGAAHGAAVVALLVALLVTGATGTAGALLAHRSAGALLAHGATGAARTLLAHRTARATGTLLTHGATGTARTTGAARTRYGRRAAGALLLLGLAHVLLVLRRGTGGGGELGAQILVLAEQAGQFGLDLVEEGIDLVLVVAFSQADGRELFVPHVLGGQRHLFTST
ncbi:hypothetical protein GCM10027160_18860 [Streptomyces calidiresistens]